MGEVKTNVAVYVDYENIHKTLIKTKTNVLRKGFFEKLRTWCKNNEKRIVQTLVYCNFDNEDLYQSHHQTTLQNYGVETIHTSNQGKNYADLKISIDVLTSMYSNDNIDEFIIVSNDKDMTPLLNAIRANKRNVYVITAGTEYNHTICEFADEHLTLEKICEEDVEYLIINDIKDKLWNAFFKYINEKLAEVGTETEYKHYSLEYNLKNLFTYCKIMSYEGLYIFKEFYDENKIIFYKYEYNGKTHIATIPSEKKDIFISKGIIKEEDIIDNYDIQSKIDTEYDKFN